MPKTSSNEDILKYAKSNNWITLWASEGNIFNVFLTPSGKLLEIYFDKNKVTFKTLLDYVCK
jgi:hypothetical protein